MWYVGLLGAILAVFGYVARLEVIELANSLQEHFDVHDIVMNDVKSSLSSMARTSKST